MKRHHFYLILLTLSLCAGASAESSFWTSSALPATAASNDTKRVTLGLQFTSDVAGSVTGVRFYKGRGNTGTHTGHLWSASGSMLASATFTNESATGWQTVRFAKPVKITAKTPYVISYTASRGRYAVNTNFAWGSASKPPLRVSGSAPGVYTYGSGSRFPASANNASNYWVDVLFTADAASSEPEQAEGLNLWSDASVPAVKAETSDTSGITLGLRFRTSKSGQVAGVRFYKGPGNNGTHVGNLWSSSGGKLAQVTFSNETASGWQEARFSTPVTISSNTTYVVSYFAPRGNYAVDEFYPWAGVNSPPLAVSNPGAGVYAYGSSARFPTGTWHDSNYWVDVVFLPESQTAPSSPPPATYTISGTVQGAGATLSLSGAKTGTATTDGQGKYTFTGLASGNYTITPSMAGYTFAPGNTQVRISTASVSGVNFTGTALPPPPAVTYTISGTVQGSGATLSLSGPTAGTTTTDSRGRYTFTGLGNGRYVVSPSMTGYTFTPATASVTVSSASVTGINFSGTALPPPPPVVSLQWGSSPSSGVIGYNLYRATSSAGPYARINPTTVAGTSYADDSVQAGRTYYYVATSVDEQGMESTYSNQASVSTY